VVGPFSLSLTLRMKKRFLNALLSSERLNRYPAWSGLAHKDSMVLVERMEIMFLLKHGMLAERRSGEI